MQPRSLSQRLKRIFLNETGQMTVFVALIFQVLFVFFAMVINIGLLVHDKINLQNAVDLGAYYGAQRQAEILNEIAHINYQIHQDNKLLAWRYHVLGTLGRNVNGVLPPATTDSSVSFSPTARETDSEAPSICVFNNFWLESLAATGNEENYCYRPYGDAGAITKIPSLVLIAPFVPGIIGAVGSIKDLQDVQRGALVNQGPLNWSVGAQFMFAYKMALASRKAIIQRLRANLVSENMLDQASQSVADGVLQTIKKNLTVSNLSSFDESAYSFKNGLATAACAGTQNDGSPTIVEMRTQPVMYYTYSTEGDRYNIDITPLYDISHGTGYADFDPSGWLRQATGSEVSDQIDNSSFAGLSASSLGFEKNPWCMAYVGVHARSSPRKPFAPFGEPVVLEARAFAQPFGGRIGPWYRSQWPQQSVRSAGGSRIDPISTARLVNNANEGGEGGAANLPNYSRYPGDQLGIRSLAHQAGFRNLVRPYRRTAGSQLSVFYFTGYDQLPKTGDPLAWDLGGPDQSKVASTVANIRAAEEIAVAPDLFDATYYSIDLNYASNYKALSGNGARFPGLASDFGEIVVPPDLGGRNGTDVEGFNVERQIEVANSGLDPILRNTLSYFLFDKAHVLTGWAPNTATNFDFPSRRFAQCSHYATQAQYMIPGACTNGGRVGYSVRLISREHLLSPNWNIGGEGQTGPIKNPPALDF